MGTHFLEMYVSMDVVHLQKFSTIPKFLNNSIVWEHCVYKESLHRSENCESSTNDGRDVTMKDRHNDVIQQLATS